VAAHIRGNIDSGVKPGMVFSSLITSEPSGIRKKSTRARPSHETASKARAASPRTSAVVAVSRSAGTSSSVCSSGRYFAAKS
jgi:hypothetical protein